MIKRTLWLILVLLPAVSFAAEEQKEGKKEQGSGPSPYTECGIGAAIFKDTAWAAASSNVIWDLGLTAITSALSSPETCSEKKVKTARLILETLPQLEKDIAAGSGVYLTALSETMDCQAAVQSQLNSGLRALYADVVSDSSYGSKTEIERAGNLYSSVKEVMQSIPNACNVIL